MGAVRTPATVGSNSQANSPALPTFTPMPVKPRSFRPRPIAVATSGVPLRYGDPSPQTRRRTFEGTGLGGRTEGDRPAPPIHPEGPALPEREAGQPRRTDDSQPVSRGRWRRLDNNRRYRVLICAGRIRPVNADSRSRRVGADLPGRCEPPTSPCPGSRGTWRLTANAVPRRAGTRTGVRWRRAADGCRSSPCARCLRRPGRGRRTRSERMRSVSRPAPRKG